MSSTSAWVISFGAVTPTPWIRSCQWFERCHVERSRLVLVRYDRHLYFTVIKHDFDLPVIGLLFQKAQDFPEQLIEVYGCALHIDVFGEHDKAVRNATAPLGGLYDRVHQADECQQMSPDERPW